MAGITLPDQETVDLGNSRITPRETYAVDPRAIQSQYRDSVANADQLARALAGLSKQVGQTEALQAERELKQKDVIAASVMNDIKVGPGGKPLQEQLTTLRPDMRPRLRAAVAESIGATHGAAEARKAYEAEIAKNPEAFNTPEAAQAFFQNWAAKAAARVGANQFYGPAYIAAAKKYFAGADANEARTRVAKMKKLIAERSSETLSESLFGKGVKGDEAGSKANTSSTGGGGNVTYADSFKSKIRNKEITDSLKNQIAKAGKMTGLNAVVHSGGQDAKGPGARRTGSNRHDHGNAADIDLTDGAGRRLSFSNPADRNKISSFITHIVAAGANGIGAGPGYMTDGRIHVGGGSSLTWGAGGSSKNAPAWVKAAYAEGMRLRKAGGRATTPGSPVSASSMIRQFEGFRATSYLDKGADNKHRIGFGSDTITKADGTVVPVTPGMTVSKADAERDLERRIKTEFAPRAQKAAGGWWKGASEGQRAALISLTYNYGNVPKSVREALKTGDNNKIAAAIEALPSKLPGLSRRRMAEAAAIRSGTSESTPNATGAMVGDFLDENSPNPEIGVQKSTLPASQLFQNFQKWDSNEELRSGDLISRKERKAKFIEVVTNRALATQDPSLLKQIPKFYVDKDGKKQAFLTDSEYAAIQKSMRDIEKIRVSGITAARKARESARKDAHTAAISEYRTRITSFYSDPQNAGKEFKISMDDLKRIQANAPDGFDAAAYAIKMRKSFTDATGMSTANKELLKRDWTQKILNAAWRGDTDSLHDLRNKINDGEVPADLRNGLVKEVEKYLDPKYAGAISGPEFKAGLKTVEEIIDGQKGGALSLSNTVKANPNWPRIRAAYVQEFNKAMMGKDFDPSNTMHRFAAAEAAAKAIVPYVKSIFPKKAAELDQFATGQSYEDFKAGKPQPQSKPAPAASPAKPAVDEKRSAAQKKLFGR